MFNPNYYRWIASSLNHHFKRYLRSAPMYVEGDNYDQQNAFERFEFRHDVPEVEEQAKDDWQALVRVNVFITTDKAADLYRVDRLIGEANVGFTNTIPLFKFGVDAVDNPLEQIACMQLQGQITVTRMGRMQPGINTMRAALNAYYIVDVPGIPNLQFVEDNLVLSDEVQ